MTKLTTRLVGITQPTIELREASPEGLVTFCARVSNPQHQDKELGSLLDYCIRNKHYSIFEMVNAVVEIEAPRDISRQLLRHRSFSFQEFCIAGDSKITTLTSLGGVKKVAIKSLYERQLSSQYSKMSDNLVRVYDEKTKMLKSAKIKEVFKTGIKPLYRLSLVDGKSVLATKDHKFLTLRGFKMLKDISEEDFVATNGLPVYQDPVWLKNAKDLSLLSKTGLQGVAELAGVSTHTIRKWLRILGLQYTKKEVSSYTPAWNKGLDRQLQPRFNKPLTEASREKLRVSVKRGKDSNLFVHGKGESWRHSVATWAGGYKLTLLNAQKFRCPLTGLQLTLKNCDVDHILPVYARPDLAFSFENLQVLHKTAHKHKSWKESLSSRLTVRYKKVSNIDFVGEDQTYDMEVDHESHNYVANGLITHNSQRYSDEIEFTTRDFRGQDEKNRQNSVDDLSEIVTEYCDQAQHDVKVTVERYYEQMRKGSVAKECARVILPEGLTMSRLYMNGTLRSWMHYLDVRDDEGVTQWEHVVLARKIKEVLLPAFPNVLGRG